tara:strand:+ start:57 stop:242 length:186 start_codon:yes stop_codon:yes gene_type:complete
VFIQACRKRQEAKVKSEGKKEHHPEVWALAEDKRKRKNIYNDTEIITVTRNRRRVEHVCGP